MSSKRRSNPYMSDDLGIIDAWEYGYEAAQYNRELDNKEGSYEHPECDDCSHVNKHQYNLKVMFTIEDEKGQLPMSSKQLAEQLADALPKEWWQDSNVATWGTVAIIPLTRHGIPQSK